LNPLRVGVIGAGWVATERHIPSFRRHPKADVVALVDRHADRAAAVAERMAIPFHTSELEALFDLDVDAVSLCTPPWTHAELACAALERGIHVFTEKPMAMNAAEAESMVVAARAAGRLLCVSHNFLFSRSVRRADRLLERDGGARYVFGVQLSSTRRRLPNWYEELPGGLLLDESPHVLYTLQHFLGHLSLEHARATQGPGRGQPASVELLVRGQTGLGQVTMLFDAPVSEWHVSLVGPSRVVDLDLFRDIVVNVGADGAHNPGDILRTSASALGQHALGFASSGLRYATKRLYWGHDALIDSFVDAVLNGGPAPVDPEESLEVVRLTDAILTDLHLV